MKIIFIAFTILMSSAVFARAPSNQVGTVTSLYHDNSTIEIDGQTFLINNESVIIHDENVILNDKVVPKETSIGYEIKVSEGGAL